jgi:hypothetical protein
LVSVSLIANRLVDLHPLPVGVKFVRNYQRQGCPDNSAHLRTVSNDKDGAILLNADKDIGVERGAVRIGLSACLMLRDQYRRKISNGQDERSCPKHSLEEPTPAYVLDWAHAIFSAANLIAARIRW